MAFLDDPRVLDDQYYSETFLENEQTFQWGALVVNYGNLPAEEYMKPMTVIAANIASGSTNTGSSLTNNTITVEITSCSGVSASCLSCMLNKAADSDFYGFVDVTLKDENDTEEDAEVSFLIEEGDEDITIESSSFSGKTLMAIKSFKLGKTSNSSKASSEYSDDTYTYKTTGSENMTAKIYAFTMPHSAASQLNAAYVTNNSEANEVEDEEVSVEFTIPSYPYTAADLNDEFMDGIKYDLVIVSSKEITNCFDGASQDDTSTWTDSGSLTIDNVEYSVLKKIGTYGDYALCPDNTADTTLPYTIKINLS